MHGGRAWVLFFFLSHTKLLRPGNPTGHSIPSKNTIEAACLFNRMAEERYVGIHQYYYFWVLALKRLR